MKRILATLSFTVVISLGAFAQKTDPVEKAKESNEMKADQKMITDDVATFLVESVDARMMDAREGKLAAEKGTTPEIKAYGKLMMRDQAALLAKLKTLSKMKNATIPTDISNKKSEGLKDLEKESGKDFDKKFVKMITIDHERDVKLFKDAVDGDDKDVKAFAQKNLPIIQSHLDKIKAINERMR